MKLGFYLFELLHLLPLATCPASEMLQISLLTVLFSSTETKMKSVRQLPFFSGENYMETKWKLSCDDKNE